ncbi:hypothetical protein C0Q70_14826 [Pomacea canaliculata]|uniref:Uncharacterized protein n=2 Tax=Pomacea canaliculata TaxID=400727 RepID=A0A2T7NT48_POMCA|nr:hypothetical protein C0Q70_14826 [Pomacea canaliculata]
MGGMSGPPSSSSSSSSSYQSPHSAFTPMGHSYFHHGFTPFGMHPSPQSNFSMMSQGLGMPASYSFIPSFHPGFMGHPFSQGLGTGSGNSFSSSGSSAGGFGFGQGQETMGSFRALLEDSPERTLTDQQSASSSISNSIGGGGLSAGSPDGNAMSMPGVTSASGSSGMGSGGGFGNSSSSMSGLPHASMQSSSNAMYGYSPMSLGYAGLSPMLGMSNPMFMPVMPSSMMGQHYPMQHGPGAPGGPLSAMGHMAAMGAHLSGPGAGMPPSSGN